MIRPAALLCSLLLAAPALALEEPVEEIYNFLAGDYRIIGKGYETTDTYQGNATIALAKEGLEVTKRIGDREIPARGRIERASLAESRVLRIRYREAGDDYEETCIYQGDLDNHARITCHLYRPDTGTDDPGMEAWFSRPAALLSTPTPR